MPWLTKSRFLSGLQCHKRLWFEIHQPVEESPEPGPALLLGRSFDKVVQQLQPGVVISRDEGMPAAIEKTAKVMAQPGGVPPVIYQPAFRAGNLAFIADVLRHVDDEFELIEVKATTRVKETVETCATEIRHSEYLAIESFGEFDALAEKLMAAIPSRGPVFAYSAGFERGILEKLAELVPVQAAPLRAVAARLVDLLPITRQAYYHRDMQGSWSIKNVMPTIHSSLDYALRGEVQDGMAAQAAFLELRSPDIEPDRAAELSAALRDYCKHDTWVMVVLRRFLCGEALRLGK